MTTTALLIAKNWPEPKSTAAGRRTLDLLKILSSAGFTINVACPADTTPFQADLLSLGYRTQSIAINSASFDAFLEQLNPSIVIYDRFVMEEQFGWRVKNTLPDALTVLDTSDLHCLRNARECSIKQNTPLDLFNDIALREIAAIYRCDLTLMISKKEIEILRKHFSIPSSLLHYLPFLTTAEDHLPGLPRSQRKHLLTLGGLKHEPNRDAVKWLKSELWPMIRQQLPAKTELHVIGGYADHAINQLNNPAEGFLIKGRVDDALSSLSEYRVNIAPLRFGAGQKGKILEGWLTCTPTITTPIGAESMATSEELGYLPTDEPEKLAQLVVNAYMNDSFSENLIRSGTKILNDHFSYSTHASAFQQRLKNVLNNKHQRRHDNFYGRLLWQNQFRAHEFMSRWIELKNR